MRFHSFAFLGVLSATAAGAAACASHLETGQSSAGTSGTGGETGGSTSSSSSVATSSSSGTGSGGDVNGMPSTTYPAPFPTPPKVVSSNGPVLATPQFVPVFFMNENSPTIQAGLTSFAAGIGATNYWTAATSEYGVGPGTSLPPVLLTEAAPASIDDTAIQTWLAGKLNGNDPLWPQPTAGTVYILDYPTGTSVTLSQQGQTAASCQQFGGYHNSIILDQAHMSMNVAYAVVPRCPMFGNLTGLDAVTGAESHELVEAVTDPYPMVDPAYSEPDVPHFFWELVLGGGEVGDMCAQNPNVFTKFTEFPFTVQRIWSNASIFAGHDPCVPEAVGEVYFNSVPELNDKIAIPGLGSMKGVKVAVGASTTIPLDLYSEAATPGPWNVSVIDAAQFTGQKPTSSYSLDRSSGANGEKLNLTITVNTAPPASQDGLSFFLVVSTLGQTQTLWVGLVSSN